MPNIGSLLREEIVRLSRKEYRRQSTSTKSATSQHRRDIAELKRQIASLESQVRALTRRAARSQSTHAAPTPDRSLRFVAKGLRSHRERLGLSAADFGRLIGASGVSVYAWESGKTKPRPEQIAKIAAVRAMGKREATKTLGDVRGKAKR